ncbi:disease resistance protein RGA2-like [Papaver somniferum]|uniref:disease resistance protein RGA2-like n=1 Tax=Papaver somniferum TaxID=3469 RepID=UPI000E70483F|nr:disease resistance protein RGA2-like [Papaver somniferum]
MAAEQILVNGVTEIIKKILPVITQHITLAWGVKDDLRKLKDTLESIQALITSAEEKQVTEATVGLWLRRLKDVVYDADDVMDEFAYETMRRHAVGGQFKLKVRALVSSSNPLVLHFTMARKIRAIYQRLDQIYKDSKMYQLQNTSITQDNLTMVLRSNRLTSSAGGDSVFLGREDAKLDIIKILINKSSSSGVSSQSETVSTLSIVGMGGLGKTTVAQMVYNDDSVKRNFEARAWICVSDPFDTFEILRGMIESITRVNFVKPSNVDVLANEVKEKLIGTKYLLVLDDLWNEDTEDWGKLKSFLDCGGLGSKILVTTRNRKVAFCVGGAVYDLKKLSSDVCWSIIEKKLLSQGGAVLTPEMTSIGKHIAEKCDGLPLAANSLGSLMCSRRDESYWLSIVDDINRLRGTSEHKKVISILKLSYDNLSYPLKQCFSYCCIFPKDWNINRDLLIRLWMAEGFLLPSGRGDNISLEDIGNEYFEDLVWSSFFQDVQKDEESGDIKTCKMHDMVHDLAASVQDCHEFGIVKVRDGIKEVSEFRRLQLLLDKRSLEPPKVLPNAMKLRTIVVVEPENFPHINSFFGYKRLRILCPLVRWHGWRMCSLSCGLEFCKLCGAFSMSKLKHLRYIDLSYIDSLGEVSLNHSYNLQTLVLIACKNVPSWLLNEIGSLKSLRHVNISSSNVKHIPENIGSLEHLSCLDLSFTEIPKLPDSITCISSLRTLEFIGCRNLDALPRELGALTRLRCLDLCGTKIEELPESCISNLCNLEIVKLGRVCELPKEINNWPKLRIFTHERKDGKMPRGIERLTCLETLKNYNVRIENEICGSPGNNNGIEELAGLNSLQVLKIRKLENVRDGKEGAEKAKLKDKRHLRELNLSWGSTSDDEDVRKIRSLKDTAVLEGLQPPPNLKEFSIKGFSGVKLPKWMMGCSLSNCLPNLVELNLYKLNNCEKLPALGMLPFLRTLWIIEIDSINTLGEEFYYQQENSSSSNTTTKRSSLFPSLVELHIGLENLEEWVAPPLSSSSCFPSLEQLNIIGNCKRLRSIPIILFSSLKELGIWGINDNAVNSLLCRGEGYMPSLTSIRIWDSPDLIYLPPLGVLVQHNTPHLQELYISECSNIQGFRDDDDLNNSNSYFQLLWLDKCPVLMSLPDLRLFTCIRSLHFEDCPGLTSLPDLRLSTSLRILLIYGCNKLNKESIPYDLKESLTFLEVLKVDFIERDELGRDVSSAYALINLMKKEY